jgi:predicted branched-subunit amino acid permease
MTRSAVPVSTGTRSAVWAGVRAMAPVLAAYAPFALVVGAAVAASDDPLAAWLSTWTIYGGAAQLAVLDVLRHGSGWVAAAVVGLVVNARLGAYATAMAPDWRTASVGRRVVAAVTLTDASWALARERDGGDQEFYLGAALTLFVGWPAMVTLGVLVNGWVSALPVTALLPALALGAIVVPQLRRRPVAIAVGTASLSAVATAGLPPGTALLVAGALGVTVGVAMTARTGSDSGGGAGNGRTT